MYSRHVNNIMTVLNIQKLIFRFQLNDLEKSLNLTSLKALNNRRVNTIITTHKRGRLYNNWVV